jgi:hypothetical protein
MPNLLSCHKIWSKAKHNAFPDLLDFQGKLLCCLREGIDHAGDDGIIRVIGSSTGARWRSLATIEKKGVDLRDPRLSIMPDGRLLLNMGGIRWKDESRADLRSYVSISKDGVNWSAPKAVFNPFEWIWRVTWYQGVGYGTSYCAPEKGKWRLSLVTTTDGIHYSLLKKFSLSHNPSEATIRFKESGEMIMLVRGQRGHGWIGRSSPPYRSWKWVDIRHRLGGPNFLIAEDGAMWAASRKVIVFGKNGYRSSVVVARMSTDSYEPILHLPSKGDCSYPGMVLRGNKLFVCYYSSHEGKSRIYLAIIG